MFNRYSIQTKSFYLIVTLLLLVLLATTACGSSPALESVQPILEDPGMEEPAAEEQLPTEAAYGAQSEAETSAQEEIQATNDNAAASAVSNDAAPLTERPNVYNRLIIKNAELEMIVADTDSAINRTLGIVTEYRGYVVSNRTWFNDGLKYATVTLGVPAENFEQMMRRLKSLAVSVTNETVSGQDVTDEFVDLESRLRNMEATANRIRGFMDQTKSIEESLEVSAQLTEIEAEIEQLKGRMTYLKDRASFSTITLQFAPQIILPTPSPTLTPTPTPTPRPTATPIVWSASRTFNQATTVTTSTATGLFKFTIDLLIWLFIVILPFFVPLLLLAWLGFRIARRLGIGDIRHPPVV